MASQQNWSFYTWKFLMSSSSLTAINKPCCCYLINETSLKNPNKQKQNPTAIISNKVFNFLSFLETVGPKPFSKHICLFFSPAFSFPWFLLYQVGTLQLFEPLNWLLIEQKFAFLFSWGHLSWHQGNSENAWPWHWRNRDGVCLFLH